MNKENEIIYCFICGKVHPKLPKHRFHYTAEGTTPDLDDRRYLAIDVPMYLRKPEMCDNCGYVSFDLDQPLNNAKDLIHSTAYITCDNLDFSRDVAKLFYRMMMICAAENAMESAFYYARSAAWVCDDGKDNESAIACRRKAYEFYQKTDRLFQYHNIGIMMDIARRAELDNVVEELFHLIPNSEEPYKLIGEYQRTRTQLKDRNALNVRSVDGVRYRYWKEFR